MTATVSLIERLAAGPLLCDGAMGTQLFEAGLAPGACGELWNVQRAEVVEEIHRRYLQAACDLLTTNSFGATGAALAKHGLADRADQLNTAAAAIACKAGQGKAIVLGDMGPIGEFLEPLGDLTVEQARDMFARQARALCAGGAGAILIETMVDPNEVIAAIQGARSVVDCPIIASYTFNPTADGSFKTIMGNDVADALQQAIEAGADVVGSNCGTDIGLPGYLELAGRIVAAAGDTPTMLQPNAGSPIQKDGQLFYPASPADMADVAKQLISLGIAIVGGCCGTTPQHLEAMGKVMGQAD